MSLQECEIAQCSPNQLKMMRDSPALASDQSPIPHHTGQVAWIPLGNSIVSLRHLSHIYMNINFSTATWGKLHAPHIVSNESWLSLWLKRWANFRQATQMKFSLSNRYVRGTLCFLSQVEWTARGPDSKEGRISLQWLKFRLVFQLTRWRDIWMPCGDPRESRRSPPHLDRRNHISLTPREAHGIQCFKRWRCLTIFENG